MTDEKMSLVIFDPIRALLAEVEEKDKALVFDHTTPEGEKELRSWVKRLRGYKGDVARLHKETKAEALSFGRKIDAVKNELTAGVDKLITERMKPLDEIEAKKRAEAEAIVKAEEDARLAKEAEEKAELERREAAVAKKEAENEEKERIEREKNIAIEAAEQARKDAERIASNQARVAEQEKAQVIEKAEREKQEAIEAEKEKARKAVADRLAKDEAEKAEQARLAEIERKRVANKKHRAQVKEKITDCLYAIIQDAETTDKVVAALEVGSIPNVTINY